MRWLFLSLLLLPPASAAAAPQLDLSPALRAFIGHATVGSTSIDLALDRRLPLLPLAILGGPTPADPALDPGMQALGAFQYGLAVVLGFAAHGDHVDAAETAIPGIVRNRDVRGGPTLWAKSDREP